MKFSDLQDAFLYVGGAAREERAAFANVKTGEVVLHSAMVELEEIPESEDWLAIPHKNDLGLGHRLALAFVAERMPDDLDRVERFFGRRGAYANFKELLGERGLLDEWFELETRRLDDAIRAWCAQVGIRIAE